MGNAALKSSRAVLREQIQLHFKSGQLGKDVDELVRAWFEDGAPLGLTLAMFQRTLDLQPEHAEAYFLSFDTDRNKKVDAFEALSALIVLAEGSWEAKVETLFPIFDFSSSGRLNFDEANIMLQSVCRGLAKVCKTPMVDDATLLKVCRQMFDAHNIRHDDTISKEQFRRWLKNGSVEAAKFLDIYQNSLSAIDVEANIAEREQVQAAVFSQLTSSNQVSAEVVTSSEIFRSALEEGCGYAVPQEQLETLVGTMIVPAGAGAGKGPGPGDVGLDRYVEVMHAWNVFNAVDVLREGALDPTELVNLMRFQHRGADPDEKQLERMRKLQRAQDAPEGTGPKMITRESFIGASVAMAQVLAAH